VCVCVCVCVCEKVRAAAEVARAESRALLAQQVRSE
jgi:hypothetical protein